MPPEVISAFIGLVGVILGVIPTYLFMRQRGLAEIEKTKAEADKTKAEAEKIRSEIQSNIKLKESALEKNLSTPEKSLMEAGTKAFVFENHRKVPWKCVLDQSQSIDIAVAFWESWVKANWESLIDFYRRGGRIRLVMTDPASDAVEIARRRFPQDSRDVFIQHIEETARYFQLALEESKSSTGAFEVYYFNDALNYLVIRADNKQLFLSFHEHAHKIRQGAQSILLDLESSLTLREYWEEEFKILFANSKRMDPRLLIRTKGNEEQGTK